MHGPFFLFDLNYTKMQEITSFDGWTERKQLEKFMHVT